jgi:predicted O-methyltransferase YrrM
MSWKHHVFHASAMIFPRFAGSIFQGVDFMLCWFHRRIERLFFRMRVDLFDFTLEYPGLPERGEIRKGRCVEEGNWRSMGLEFGRMADIVSTDPLYKEACAISGGRSIMTEPRRMNIFLIMKFFLSRIPSGHLIEFGAYKGGNALFMAYVAGKLYPGMKVYALDTFNGMPEVDESLDWHKRDDFNDADLDGLNALIDRHRLDNLIPIRGLFQDTVPGILSGGEKFSFCHIDCDIYSAVSYAYDAIKPAMVPGGYIAFDDPLVSSCIGAMEAVEDLLYHRDRLHAEQMFPHSVFRIF